MASQQSPASPSSAFSRIVSTLLCVLAIVIALVPCSTAMAAISPAASTMTMPPAAHCAECCPKSTQSVAPLCCAAPIEPAQQITLTAYVIPAPTSSLTTALPAISFKTDAPLQASASVQLRPPLHPILRI